MLEAISICEMFADKKLQYSYTDTHRSGDHIWYISDVSKFKKHYPKWDYHYNIQDIIQDIFQSQTNRLQKQIVCI